MVTLKKVEFKNFRSYGNQLTTVDLTRNKSTVITGANGNGKTTIEQAIEFGLFGEVVGVNKGDLVNDINKKDCYVKVEFEKAGQSVVVERGIKPNILSIWVDGVRLDEEAGVVKQQNDFEESILGFNLSTFKQVISISGGNFVPFMKMTAAKRREFVEELLGLTIFSDMQKVHLGDINATREKIRDTESTISKLTASIDAYKEGIRNAEKNDDAQKELASKAIAMIEADIEAIRETIREHHTKIEAALLEAGSPEANAKRADKMTQLIAIMGEIRGKILDAEKKRDFFTSNDACPTCSQPIVADLKDGMVHSLTCALEELQEGSNRLVATIDQTRTKVDAFRALKADVDRIRSRIEVAEAEIRTKEKSIAQYREVLSGGASTGSDSLREKLNQNLEDLAAAKGVLSDLLVDVQYNTLIQAMIKDTGIKAMLVKQYIPLMNKKINEYMDRLGMPIVVTLDENFDIEILSLYCKSRPYATFSAGERTRIDIAILFAWRDVAKTINSLDCNVLFIDEAFDKELDVDGVECFTDFLNSMAGTNVFMISHRTEIIERMRSNIKINKVGNFSRIDT